MAKKAQTKFLVDLVLMCILVQVPGKKKYSPPCALANSFAHEYRPGLMLPEKEPA